MDTHKSELKNRAVHIAESMGEFWNGNNVSQGNPQRGQGHNKSGQSTGYGAYLRFLDDITVSDIWIVDKNLNQITRGHGKSTLSYSDLPSGADDSIKNAMKGNITFSENFGTYLGSPSITVAVPITLQSGEIYGVVLMHEQIENIHSVTKNSLAILLISIGVGAFISVLIAGILARKFTKPLSKMKSAAVKISDGDYKVRSGVVQNDEIGELAKTFDNMAMKLDVASKERDKLENIRRDFVANISHELRTPVTVIRGSLEALCDGVVSDPEMVEEYHNQMFSESLHLDRLVSDLLDLSRLQNPDFTMNMCEVDFKEISEDAVRSTRRIASEKNVEILFSHSGNNFSVFADYNRLRQILLIFLDNAVKFSPKDGTIEVLLNSNQDTIKLSVIDGGPGIAVDDLPYIFDRFYKQRLEENKSGTGLGLAIAKQISDRHGAIIKAKNNKNKGSQFSLTMNTIKSH
ncbi:sensor histidine kinase [Peptostreptococcus faecalis]|uniref:sensor histidine kinase n=1 Tax=Peptostreptococcus faecalis TaxID=2045015 RepID=UPI0015E1077B|nr:HAMP domain-containing sensor histidine kinase [Peptostreptococcus faecalis]